MAGIEGGCGGGGGTGTPPISRGGGTLLDVEGGDASGTILDVETVGGGDAKPGNGRLSVAETPRFEQSTEGGDGSSKSSGGGGNSSDGGNPSSDDNSSVDFDLSLALLPKGAGSNVNLADGSVLSFILLGTECDIARLEISNVRGWIGGDMILAVIGVAGIGLVGLIMSGTPVACSSTPLLHAVENISPKEFCFPLTRFTSPSAFFKAVFVAVLYRSVFFSRTVVGKLALEDEVDTKPDDVLVDAADVPFDVSVLLLPANNTLSTSS